MKEKEEKEEEKKKEEDDKDEAEPMTRQIQIQKLHFNVLMSTEDPKENMDYLVSKAIEVLKTQDTT